MTLVLSAIAMGFVAFVWTCVLTRDGMLFAPLYGRLQSMNDAGKLPDWVFYPLIHCERCCGGQIALWFCVFNRIALIDAVLIICIAIYAAYLFNSFHNLLKRRLCQ